jgi:predicted nucleotidyltransferase
MTTSERVQEICDRIASDFHPDKIIVFGSHAYGTPGRFSDLDLLVVMPFEGSPGFHLSALSRRSLRLGGEVFPRAFTAETPRTQRWRRE